MRDEKEPKRAPIGEPVEMQGQIPILEVAQAESLSAKQDLRESESKYRTLVETLPHAVAIIQDEKIVFANKTAAEFVGFKRSEDILGQDPLHFVAESEKDRLRDYMRRRLTGDCGVPEQYETVVVHPDGEEIPVEVRVKTFDLHGDPASQFVVTDLRGRRQFDTRLRLFTGVLEQIAEGLAIVDLQDRLLFVNQFFALMHGYQPDELLGRHVAVLYPAEEFLSAAAANEETRRSGMFSGELVHRVKDGTSLPVFSASSLIRDEQGSPVGMAMIVRDISQFKISEEIAAHSLEKSHQRTLDLEQQLRETAEQLEDSQSEQEDYTTLLEQHNEALNLVIGEIESKTRERERDVHRSLSANVLPIIDQLKSERLPDPVRLLLISLEFNLKSLFAAPPRAFSQETLRLTPQETRLCELIRSGLTSKQIADAMGISSATVVTHRANIRKKLGLVGSDNNLATYLRSQL